MKKSWTELRDEATAHLENQQWLEAMNCYTKAIRRNLNEASLYCNRAVCEIRLKKFDLAREDAQTALFMDPKNIKFHQTLSEALMGLKMYGEALVACEGGLTLDPRDPALLIRQRDCEVKVPKVKSKQWLPEHLSPNAKLKYHPNSLYSPPIPAGIPEPGKDDIEICTTEDFMLDAHIAVGNLFLKPSNYNAAEALSMFQQAADKGSPHGMFYLGLMHFYGRGLPINPLKALKLWRKAAARKPFRDRTHFVQANLGVAESENAIAEAYRDGKGVEQSDDEAFKWYERSANHGHVESFSSLATFLMLGRGCQKNVEAARKWFRMAIIHEAEKEVEGIIPDALMEIEEGISFQDLSRIDFSEKLPTSKNDAECTLYKHGVLPWMMDRLMDGLTSATFFLAAYRKLGESRDLLRKNMFEEAVKKLCEMWSTWDLRHFDYRPFIEAARSIVLKNNKNAAAIFTLAICLPTLVDEERLLFAQRCVKLDPSVADYHFLLGTCWAAVGKHKKALKCMDQAINQQRHPNWLFLRAKFMKSAGFKKFRICDMIEAFQRFLSAVQMDYAHVAEAYYCIGELYCWQNEVERALVVFSLGLMAEDERVRLPCLPDLDKYPPKDTIENYLKLRGKRDLENSIKKILDMCHGSIMCAACTKNNGLFPCSKCKELMFCSKKCQANYSIIHKLICK